MKKPKPDPQLAAWCAALATVQFAETVPPGWLTVKQLSEKLKKPRSTINRQIATTLENGKCEVRLFRVSVGRMVRSTPHYRLK